MTKNIHDYQDIIHLPHHISIKHPQMSLEDRAAQFAPFAALTGHKDSIKETERLTAQRKILDEDRIAIINFRLQQLLKHLTEAPLIKITYFEADQKKSGGQYITIINHLKKINEYENLLVLENGVKINIDDIYELE